MAHYTFDKKLCNRPYTAALIIHKILYMRKNIDEYLYNEAIKYLGRYPATKKKN